MILEIPEKASLSLSLCVRNIDRNLQNSMEKKKKWFTATVDVCKGTIN